MCVCVCVNTEKGYCCWQVNTTGYPRTLWTADSSRAARQASSNQLPTDWLWLLADHPAVNPPAAGVVVVVIVAAITMRIHCHCHCWCNCISRRPAPCFMLLSECECEYCKCCACVCVLMYSMVVETSGHWHISPSCSCIFMYCIFRPCKLPMNN